MIFTAEERRALLALLALLLLGQLYSMWEGARRARPDRELSLWLTRMERMRDDSLALSAVLPAPGLIPAQGAGMDSAGAEQPTDAGAPEVASGPSVEPASAIPPGLLAQGRLLINQAGIRDLDALPGIGPSLAKRILEEREKTGPFRKPEDLLRVSGIGPKKLAGLRGKIDCSIPPAEGAPGGK